MEEIAEANIRSQAAKYKNCKDYVEPNLKKRFEQKRERARLRAQLQQDNLDIQSIMNMSTSGKMYQTHTEKLDREGITVDQSNLLNEGLNARGIANNEFG